jgi:predicted enzyme related to lactoylglutathione lyase
MGQPVAHFEIIGANPDTLRDYYRELFGWTFNDNAPVAQAISEKGKYSFIDTMQRPVGVGIPGGVGGGSGYSPRALFYVWVLDVETALQNAVRLGGTRLVGPAANPNGKVVVGQFADLEGNLIGVAGPK